MNFLDNLILDFKNRIKVSDRKINTITEEAERLREKLKNNGLHKELRKYADLANEKYNIFYCSTCGDQFTEPGLRTRHTEDQHEGL